MRQATFFALLIALLLLPAGLSWGGEPPVSAHPRDEKYLQQDLARLKANPKDPELLREAGISYCIVGSPDNWAYIKEARRLLEESNRLRPNDPFTLMHLGSTLALQARSSELGLMERNKLVTDGLALMDRSISLQPNNYRLRLLRATSSLGVPSFFGRDKILAEDASFIRKVLEPNPPKDQPKHLLAAGYLVLGATDEKAGKYAQAREYYNLTIAYGRGTRYESQARKKLSKIQGK